MSRVPYPNPQKVGKIQKSLDFFKIFVVHFLRIASQNKESLYEKTLPIIVFICMLALLLFGCDRQETLLNPQKPVTLTMWHVYGEQADSPMNRYVEDFNRTVGKEKGIIVNVTLMSNASQIGQKLVNAQNGVAGVPAMPDLFFCHNSNAQELGANNLLDWQDVFRQANFRISLANLYPTAWLTTRSRCFPCQSPPTCSFWQAARSTNSQKNKT